MDGARSPQVARVVIRALARSLLVAGVLVGASLVLCAVSRRLASVVLVAGSCVLLVRSYGREWPLGWWTCLVPVVGALGGYAIQVALLGGRGMAALVPSSMMLGALFGLVGGSGHKVAVRGGRIVARRTLAYLLVWAAFYCLTQGVALYGSRKLVALGLAGGGFSAAMVAVMSLVVLRKYLRERVALWVGSVAAELAVLVAVGLAALGSAGAPASARGASRSHALEESPPALTYYNIGGAMFKTRLPTDREIRAAVFKTLHAPTDKFTFFRGPTYGRDHNPNIEEAFSDERVLKFHATDVKDPVAASVAVLLFTRVTISHAPIRIGPGRTGALASIRST